MATAVQPDAFVETDEDNDPAKALELPAEQLARIVKNRAVARGSIGVRAQGEALLPRLEGESAARYAIRAIYGAMHPAFDEMLEAPAGVILQTPITFEDDMPPEAIALAENIDGRSKGIMKYTRELLRFANTDGFAGTFTDMPRADDPRLNRAKASAAAVPGAPLDAFDGQVLGLRPYCIQVKAGDFHAEYETIGGQEVLVKFTRRERVRRRVGKFGKRTVTQYRVYQRFGDTVTCELWREPLSGGRAVLVPGSETTLTNCDHICWVPMELGPMLDDGTIRPVLDTLCDLVLQYYQVQNGMMSLSFEAFVATIVRVGAIPIKEEVDAEGNKVLIFPTLLTGKDEVIEVPLPENGEKMPSNPVYYMQPDSDVLAPADVILGRIQGLIDMVCNALYGADVSGESGEAKKQKARGGNAKISTMALAVKEHWEIVFQDLMMFMGRKAGGVVVKTSFEDLSLSAQDITAITGLVESGLDVEDAVEVLVERKFFGPHAKIKDIADRWRDNRAAAQDSKTIAAELKADALKSQTPPLDNAA